MQVSFQRFQQLLLSPFRLVSVAFMLDQARMRKRGQFEDDLSPGIGEVRPGELSTKHLMVNVTGK